MAGTVTSQLTLVADAETVTGWASGIASTASTAAIDTFGLKKQGTNCLVLAPSAQIFSQVFTVTSVSLVNATLYVWILQTAINLLGTMATGGLRIRVQDGTNWGEWYVGGQDSYGNLETPLLPAPGGWICYAIDCNRAFTVTSATSPTMTAITSIGVGINAVNADPSGNAVNNFFWDVIRHDNRAGLGGGLRIDGGTVAIPTTFQDFFAADNLAANAYGIVRKAVGAFAVQGPLTIGSTTAGVATEFNDTGQLIVWDDARVKNSGVYGITIQGNSTVATNVTWGQFVSSVASKGVEILSPGNTLPTLLTATGGTGPGYGSLSVGSTTTIVRTVGSWLKDGYVVGTRVTTLGFTTAANNGTFHVTATSALTLTVSETTLVIETGATTRTVNGVNDLRWDLVMTSAVGVVTPKLYACTFKGMGRGTLISTATLRSCTFSNFGDITPAGATIDSCTFQDVNTFAPISGTWALVVSATTDVNSKITNCKFINCNKAIKITAIGTYTFDNLTFSGNTFDIENASTGLVTINAINGANPVTVTNTGGGSSTVINNSKTLKVTVTDALSGATIQNSRVAIYKSGDLVDGHELLNALSDASGVVTTTFNYSVDQAIVIRVRTETPSILTPVNAAFSTATTGGTLVAGTYFYRVTATNDIGETLGSAQTSQVTTGTTSTVTVNWNAVVDATGYKVYGRATGAELLMTTLGNVLTFTDTGSITPSGALPAVNTTGTTRYFAIDATGTITVNGFTASYQLVKDTIASSISI